VCVHNMMHLYAAILCARSGINYLVQPFTMYAIARLFFDVFYASILSQQEQDEYIAGCIILGGTPCTAMVFVWSLLTNGDSA
jgi:ACR3 family arsenite transporter